MRQSIWRSVRMVAWSFFGIRNNGQSQEEVAGINPVHLVVAGITGALVLVLGLVLLVNWVAAP